jgi:hypothetical protein
VPRTIDQMRDSEHPEIEHRRTNGLEFFDVATGQGGVRKGARPMW